MRKKLAIALTTVASFALYSMNSYSADTNNSTAGNNSTDDANHTPNSAPIPAPAVMTLPTTKVSPSAGGSGASGSGGGANSGGGSASVDQLNQLLMKLNERQHSLDEREMLLDQRQSALDSYQKRLNQDKIKLTQIQASIEQKLKEIRVQEDNNTKQLATVYGNTDPKAAAAVIVKMDVKKAVALFQMLAPFTAGKIMAAIGKTDPAYAANLSEHLTPDFNFVDNLTTGL